MERTAFLDRLRGRLAHEVHPNLPHPLVRVDGVPRVDYDQDLGDPVAAFVRNATMQGASVRRIDSVEAFLSGVVAELSPATAVVSNDPEVAAAAETLASAGVVVRAFDGPHPDADLGVVGAAYAIAATGTVVFDAARAGGRSASLLPAAIAVVVREDAVLREAGELFRAVGERLPDGLPSQLVLCTGPSKSGDIELELTTGVHGPGVVHIGLI